MEPSRVRTCTTRAVAPWAGAITRRVEPSEELDAGPVPEEELAGASPDEDVPGSAEDDVSGFVEEDVPTLEEDASNPWLDEEFSSEEVGPGVSLDDETTGVSLEEDLPSEEELAGGLLEEDSGKSGLRESTSTTLRAWTRTYSERIVLVGWEKSIALRATSKTCKESIPIEEE